MNWKKQNAAPAGLAQLDGDLMPKVRYKNYWYYLVLTMIKRYPKRLAEEDSVMSWTYYHAIERAINEIKVAHKDDFADRLKAFNLMYFSGNETRTAVAEKIHVSRRTLDYWVSDFVERVGKNAGFRNKKY